MNRGAGAHSLLRLMGPAAPAAAVAAGLLALGGRVVRLVGVGVDEDIVRVSLWVWRWVVWANETPIKGVDHSSVLSCVLSGNIRLYARGVGKEFFFLLAFSMTLNLRCRYGVGFV